jgi:uncharacterized repeat protein (TIGR02543 family)
MKKKTLSCVLLCAALVLAALGTACNTDSPAEGEIAFTITFDSMGGSAVPGQTVAPGGLIQEPRLPTKDGYVFNRWNLDPEGVERWIFLPTALLQADTVSQNITLYAGWLVDQPVNISFYLHEADYTANPKIPIHTVEKHMLDFAHLRDECTPLANAYPGYLFLHWYRAGDTGKTPVPNILVQENSYDFIADWIGAVAVTFDTCGGTPISPVTVGLGAKINTANYNPSFGSALFEGWYFDTLYTQRVPDELEVTQSITLYARWFTMADRLKYSGVWKHPDGKITYIVNSNLTAWYYNEDGSVIDAMRWRPLVINGKTVSLNDDGDILYFDDVPYEKAKVDERKTIGGNADLSRRWVYADRFTGVYFVLKSDGTGSIEYQNIGVTPNIRMITNMWYTFDDDNVYMLSEDGDVLLTIEYDIQEGSDPTTGRLVDWLGKYKNIELQSGGAGVGLD